MEIYIVYILKSLNSERTYVGFTNDIERRLKEHNSGKSKYTSKFMSWKLVYKEEFNNKEEAVNKERYYKTAAGRRKLKRILS